MAGRPLPPPEEIGDPADPSRDAQRRGALPAPSVAEAAITPQLPPRAVSPTPPSASMPAPPAAPPSSSTPGGVDAPSASATAAGQRPRPWDTLPGSGPDAPGGVDAAALARRRRADRYGLPVSLVPRAVGVVVTVGGSLVALGWLVWVLWDRRGLTGDLADGLPVTREQLAAADDRVNTAVLTAGVTLVIAAPAVMAWMQRAYRNVGSWRPIHHRVGWAVGGWLVPFVNLVRPGRIMAEIVENSPVTGRRAGLVWWWWIVWLASWLAVLFVGSLDAATPTDFVRRETLAIATAALLALAAVLLLVIVVRATLDQRPRLETEPEFQGIAAPTR